MKSIIPILLAACAAFFLLPQSAQACACCNTYQVVNVASNDVLYIRTGPNKRYKKTGEIPPGSACVIKTGKCSGRWCTIQYGKQKGWVHTGYLRFMRSPRAASKAPVRKVRRAFFGKVKKAPVRRAKTTRPAPKVKRVSKASKKKTKMTKADKRPFSLSHMFHWDVKKKSTAVAKSKK